MLSLSATNIALPKAIASRNGGTTKLQVSRGGDKQLLLKAIKSQNAEISKSEIFTHLYARFSAKAHTA